MPAPGRRCARDEHDDRHRDGHEQRRRDHRPEQAAAAHPGRGQHAAGEVADGEGRAQRADAQQVDRHADRGERGRHPDRRGGVHAQHRRHQRALGHRPRAARPLARDRRGLWSPTRGRRSARLRAAVAPGTPGCCRPRRRACRPLATSAAAALGVAAGRPCGPSAPVRALRGPRCQRQRAPSRPVPARAVVPSAPSPGGGPRSAAVLGTASGLLGERGPRRRPAGGRPISRSARPPSVTSG